MLSVNNLLHFSPSIIEQNCMVPRILVYNICYTVPGKYGKFNTHLVHQSLEFM